MKKSTKLLSIIVLAVLFVPLFSIFVYAAEPKYDTHIDKDSENFKKFEGIDLNYMINNGWIHYTIWNTTQYPVVIFFENNSVSGTVGTLYDRTSPGGTYENKNMYYWDINQKKWKILNSSYYFIGYWDVMEKIIYTSIPRYGTNANTGEILATINPNVNPLIKLLNFDELTTMSIRELPYYMFYEDGDHNYWYQEYGQIPFFNLVGSKYADYTNMEFEVNWNGIGGSKTYRYNTDTNKWELYFTDSNYYISVPYAENWFKIHRANFDISIGDESVTPPLYEKWNSQDPTTQNNLKLISPSQPIKTVHDKLRLVVKYTAVYDSKSKIESKDISIFPSANAKIVNIDYKKTMSQEHMKWYDLVEKTVTFDIELNDPVLTWTDNKTTLQIQAVAITKKDNFGNIILQGHSSRLFVDIEKSEMVDSDGDGYDDNTGETGHWDTDLNIDTENELPTRSQYPTGIVGEIEFLGDTLLYWVKTPFTMFRNGLLYITTLVNETFSWTNSYATFVGRMFSFLPGPVIDMLGLMFMVIIITTLIKVVRG